MCRDQKELYAKPISQRFPNKYEWLFEGVNMVEAYADDAYTGLVGERNTPNKGYISDINDKEACQKANIGLFLKNVMIQRLSLYFLERASHVDTRYS